MRSAMQTYSSRDVAELVGLTFPYFRTLMALPDCPTPATKVGRAYVWLDADVKRLRKWLASRPKPGRPKKPDPE